MNTTFIVLLRKLVVIFSFTSVILLSPQKVFAAVYINEFSSNTDPDWVEIYNSGPDLVDLSLYRLRDNTSSNKKDLSGNLNSGEFGVIEWSDRLNNAGDSIKLLLIANDPNTLDQVNYGDIGGVNAPVSTQSAGRETNGGSNWVVFNIPTKGLTNNTSTPAPSATPTSTPTPTRTPTPTKTPTPTLTPKPQATEKPNTPTPTKASSTSVLGSTTAPKVSPSATITQFRLTSNKNSKKDILDGVSTTKSASPTSKKVEVTKTQVLAETSQKPKNNTLALFSIIGGGASLIACGILLFRKYKSSDGFNPI